jgi:hypothetical protein
MPSNKMDFVNGDLIVDLFIQSILRTKKIQGPGPTFINQALSMTMMLSQWGRAKHQMPMDFANGAHTVGFNPGAKKLTLSLLDALIKMIRKR